MNSNINKPICLVATIFNSVGLENGSVNSSSQDSQPFNRGIEQYAYPNPCSPTISTPAKLHHKANGGQGRSCGTSVEKKCPQLLGKLK